MVQALFHGRLSIGCEGGLRTGLTEHDASAPAELGSDGHTSRYILYSTGMAGGKATSSNKKGVVWCPHYDRTNAPYPFSYP